MKISMIGIGYVGLATGVGLASIGHEVIGVGREEGKIDKINSGDPIIFEPAIDESLDKTIKSGNFRATTDLKKAIEDSDISFICVGTPPRDDGSIDLSDMKDVSRQIGQILKKKDSYHVIVIKSTVIPGTTKNVITPLIEENSGKKAGRDFGVCMNPEFLREGKALNDFLKPDRIVIGELDKRSGDKLEEFYKDFNAPILRTNLKTAEMIKYVSNAFLATKISFSNEIGNICKKLGIDTYEVMKGVGLDHRISAKFLRAGCGFGGSCFPKDVKGLLSMAKEIGYKPELLESVLNVNKKQKIKIMENLESKMENLQGKKIAILGLAFNPDTDDIRESPAIDIISILQKKGSIIAAYDPKAMENFKKLFPQIVYAESTREALKDSEACLILTDWDEFKNLNDKDFDSMKNKLIIEGRRVLDKNNIKTFEGICW